MYRENIKKVQELSKAAERLIDSFPGQRIFAFYGKMGAGKTTFIQSICKKLGTNDHVTSPTFALINEYKTESDRSIFHFDFYRMKSLEEAFDLGYEDYFYSSSYCLIEWPELVETLLPREYVEVKIEADGDNTRHIEAQLIKQA